MTWTIVAERLQLLADPLAAQLVPRHRAAAAVVVGEVTRALAPPELEADPPPWLWPAHHRTLRRVLAALEAHRGALVADPTGAGKTWLALAVAHARAGRGACVCCPAVLAAQWRDVARETGVPVTTHTLERLSRGIVPPGDPSLVILDESQHLRATRTRRYRTLAPWLVGRRVLLLSATPVVNRAADLAAQLALAVRDDALAGAGVPSLREAIVRGPVPAALGLVVLEQPAPARPAARPRPMAPPAAGADWRDDAAARVEALGLSRDAGIAALVRAQLLRAAASSAAALHDASRGLLRLVAHAADAGASGAAAGRAAIRRWCGLDGQLVLWELLGARDDAVELVTDDLPALRTLVAAAAAWRAADDPKLAPLLPVLGDGRPTVIFSAFRATAHALRERLGPRTAWCTGGAAGIGPLRASRALVLALFRSAAAAEAHGARTGRPAPHLLVATDVASEGLDLARLERVVHYDLPWTPARLAQREGRARRASSPHAAIEVVQLFPHPALERHLEQLAALRRKARLPARVGLGDAGRGCWRWRAEIADALGGAHAPGALAAVAADPPGALVAVRVDDAGGRTLALHCWWVDARGDVHDDAPTLDARLRAAAAAPPAAGDAADWHDAIAAIVPRLRRLLQAHAAEHWRATPPRHAALAARLRAAIGQALRARDDAARRSLERALALVHRGHTAGEARLLRAAATLPAERLPAHLARMPDAPAPAEPLLVALHGLVAFRGAGDLPGGAVALRSPA